MKLNPSIHLNFKKYINDEARQKKLVDDKHFVFSKDKMINELDLLRKLKIKYFNTSANSDVYSDNKDDIIFSKELSKYLAKYPEIQLSSLHYVGSVFEIDEEKNNKILEQMERVVELFKNCHPKVIVAHPGVFGDGGFKYNLPRYQEAVNKLGERAVMEKVANNFRFFGKIAAKYNIKIAIENIYKGRVYSKISDLKALVDLVDLENVGFCLDIGHANYEGIDIKKTINSLAYKLYDVHITDNFGDKDGHLPVGFGSINWIEVCKDLIDVNYDGCAEFEFFGWPGYDLKESIYLSVQMWKTIMHIVEHDYNYFDFLG